MNSYLEEPILFGPQAGLVGVLTKPTTQRTAPLACLMFNFGVAHRVGPRRIQVKLARRLAEEGVSTLRFDLAGIGDSRASDDVALGFEEQAVTNLRSAIDHVEATLGIRRIVIFGLCSGVRHGYQAALQDDRVVGLLAFDGYQFTSRASNLMRRAQRFAKFPIAQSRHWINRLLGKEEPEGDLLAAGTRTNIVTANDFRQGMDTLLARDVSVYLVYSATLQTRDRNKDQMHGLRGAAFLNKVRYEFMPAVDHSFTQLAAQELFIDAMCSWVCEVRAKQSEVPLQELPRMEPTPQSTSASAEFATA